MFRNIFIIILTISLSSCISSKKLPDDIILKPASANSLNGFWDDDLTDFWKAYIKSCDQLVKKKKNIPFISGNKYRLGNLNDWKNKCYLAYNFKGNIHEFIHKNYLVYKIETTKKKQGLFTGYYEANLNGSIVKTDRYRYPIYKLPDNKILKTMSRAEIESGGFNGHNLELMWVDDNVDLFFMHIQGSGRIHTPDGEVIRIGYAGQNGYPYTAIGKTLLDIEQINQKDLSAHTIKRWLKHNPEKANDIMNQNESYIYFRTVNAVDGPIGAESSELTPMRSMAVDRRYIPLGAPLWLETKLPQELYKHKNGAFNHMLMSQDTGGAIKGAIRGDVFFGHGKKAEMLASYMKSRGEYYIFVPNNVIVQKIK